MLYISHELKTSSVSSKRSVKMDRAITAFLLFTICQSVLPAAIENPARPNIISRAEWGAKPAEIHSRNLSVNPPPYVIIHHSASDGCTTQAICQARVRSFQNYHMKQKGWGDIGYNFVVGEDGNVYEGRGWGIHGAHSRPYNAKSIGICIIGNFVNRSPNAAAIEATKKLIDYGVSIGKIKSNYTLFGHRQTTQTSCPGDTLYELIQSWPKWSSAV